MKEFEVKFSDQVKNFMSELSEEDKKELEKGIEKLKRNPFCGTSCISGPVGWYLTAIMKVRWLWREIELLFTKSK